MNAKLSDVHVGNGEGAGVPPSVGHKVPQQRESSPRYPATLADAAAICHTPWDLRDPEIDEARRRQAIEDSRRERDEYTTDNAQDWER